MYNSDANFVGSKMTPVLNGGALLIFAEGHKLAGYVKRDDRDIVNALFLSAAFAFAGPAGDPQQMPNGGVIVYDGKTHRAVQPDIFMQTYRLANAGAEITDLAAQIAAAEIADSAE